MTNKKEAQTQAGERKERQAGIAAAMRATWPLIKIYLLFGVVLLAFFTITMIKPVYFGVILPFNNFLAWSSRQALHLFGSGQVTGSGAIISQPGFAIDIAEGCNGIYALAIVVAGIVAFPAPWRPKLTGLSLAVILIMVLNYVRIITLWYAGAAESFIFDTMHLYVWEFIIIALGGAFWYFWYEKAVKKR